MDLRFDVVRCLLCDDECILVRKKYLVILMVSPKKYELNGNRT